jgi:hypothetical protein
LENREFFSGREKLIEGLRQKLAEHNFLAVLGPSGCGKSSVAMAGLIPALENREPGLKMEYMTPGSDPMAKLEITLAQAHGSPPVLVVDQFEEMFTLCADESKRQAFLDRLLTVPAIQRVVITMRADFWGDCANYTALKETMLAHQELIAAMDSSELRRAMEGQAQKVGLRFAADLSNIILDDVKGEPGAMPLLQHTLLELWKRRHGRWLLSNEYREKIGGVNQAIARTADEIYEHSPKENQERIRYIFIRLTRLADETASEQEQRDTRRRRMMQELVAEGDSLEVVRRLVHRLGSENARLVVIKEKELGAKPEEAEVEVSHEALIRYWPRLQTWLDEDRAGIRLREGISQAAREWRDKGKEGEDEGLLVHRGRRLEDAEALSRRPRFALNEIERAYVNACITLRERAKVEEQRRREIDAALKLANEAEARRKAEEQARVEADQRAEERTQAARKLRLWFISAAALAAIAFVTAIIALSALRQAAQQTRIATARQLAAQSQSTLGNYPQRSVLLAVEALATSSRAGEARVPIAEEALRQALAKIGGRGLSAPHRTNEDTLAISPDNHWLVTTSEDMTDRLWDLTARHPASAPILLRGHEAPFRAVAISTDSHWLITRTWDGTARLWDLTARDPASAPIVLRGHEEEISDVAISPNNHWLATVNKDKTARLYDLTARDPGASPIVLRGHEEEIRDVAISPNNHWLATVSKDKTARLYDLTARDPAAAPIILRDHEARIEHAIAISPDHHWLVTGSWDWTARLYDLTARDPAATPIVLRGHEGQIQAVAISPDNHWLVTGAGDGTARLWNLRLDELVDLACRTVGRNLTREEWQQYMGNQPYQKTCPNLP